ncbi:MAG: flavodoxin [Clostridia bacterium]|nr:flavodoxin [Clostridia bacterium]
MKKIITVITLIAVLVMILAACGQQSTNTNGENNKETVAPTDASAQTDETEPDDPTAADPTQPAGSEKDVLVVFFSATGTTKAVAERIAAYTGGDLYEIKAAREYTDADLNWHDSGSRTTIEQNDKSARPEIGSEDLSLDGYKTVFIGYPIWWGEEPRILDTFVEKYDFTGLTCIPFCTSGGSGVGRSDKNLADHAGSGNWESGKLLNRVSDADLQSWVDSVR